MIAELVIEHWLRYGLGVYKANPLLTELVFMDSSHHGFPGDMGEGFLQDDTKRWLPNEFTGAQLRYGSLLYAITGNTGNRLLLQGDPSLAHDLDSLGYSIIPVPALDLIAYFAQHDLPIVGAKYGQVPTIVPCFTISLDNDNEAQFFIGGVDDEYVVTATGAEHVFNRADVTGTYHIGIWTNNRLACLWLYSWLVNWYTASWDQFGSWGLHDVAMSGTDLHPATPFLPEQVFVRQFTLTAARWERAVTIYAPEYVSDLSVAVHMAYAQLRTPTPKR